jgi:hypothetical protein
MITIPISARPTDKVGAGKIVLHGLTMSALGVPGLRCWPKKQFRIGSELMNRGEFTTCAARNFARFWRNEDTRHRR